MKYMDIKPEPKDEWTLWQYTKNNLKANLVSEFGRHITIKEVVSE